MSNSTLKNQIKLDRSKVFRRLFIRRRNATTGLFEDDFLEISNDVKKWGKIKTSLDDVRLYKIKLSAMQITLSNSEGKYNSNENNNSHWFGFADQQRTIVKLRAGFIHQTQTADGIFVNVEFPSGDVKYDDDDLWDQAFWDTEETLNFTGIISGDPKPNDQNEVSFNIRPMMQIFRDFSARNLTGFDSSMTASKFMELLRDQTDGSSNFIFRPFFEDTTTNWDIATTTTIYTELNTSTAEDVRDLNCWEIIERLAEAENHIAYVDTQGKFVFKDRNSVGTATAFEFHGLNSGDTEFGHTIKRIESFGKKISKFYSRVEVKHNSDNTITSISVAESSLLVAGNNSSWNLGQRTLKINNVWIPASTADSIAAFIFNEVSTLKKEIKFSSSFVPQLDILDKITMTYNSGEFAFSSLWDVNNWGDDTETVQSTDLVWNADEGDSIDFNDKEFKLLSYEVDLDNLQCNFIAREF